LARGTEWLQGASDSPRADASLLLSHVLRRNREWVSAHDDAAVLQDLADSFTSLCRRRARGEPVAYLVGSAYFYGREFTVNDSVLIPRPETEHLIDEARARIGHESMRVLDVGTGCGAIACTIAAETGAIVDATDFSRQAIALATQNARHLGVTDRCRFHVGDLAQPVWNDRFDLIVANLPYILTQNLPQPPDPVSFEPRQALDGGPTGLTLYERLVPTIPSLINEGGMVLLEAAPPTIEKLATLLRRALPNFTVSVGNDYAGLARYLKAIEARREGGACS
jgi:release factor glutamine methyltransferase